MEKPNERIDDLLVGGLKIVQDKRAFCFGIDAVLLADFAREYPSDHTLDLCSGNGIIPLLLCAKTKTTHFSCVEIQQTAHDLAQKSVTLNALSERISLYHMDLKKAPEVFAPHSFSLITCNPPYTEMGRGLVNPKSEKAVARHELYCSLSDILSVSSKLLKPGGIFTMVHRPQRLTDIIEKMREVNIEPKTIRFAYKNAISPANLVLVSGMAGGGKELTVLPPLILYDENGHLTQDAKHLYDE
jgi:Predicted O-methyltransferase